MTKTKTKKPAAKTTVKKAVAKKPVVKKTTAKKTPAKKTTAKKPVAVKDNRDDFISTWRLNTTKAMNDLGHSDRQTLEEEVFPAYCRAAGMPHAQVVKAVGIVRGFTHEAKELAGKYIKKNKKLIGNNKISIAFPVTGLSDGRGGTPKVIIEHQSNGVKVNTADGEVHEDLNVTVSTVHLGPTKLGRLTK